MAKSQRPAFEIGNTAVQPGTRQTINLSMSLLSNHTPMDIPVHVIHGKKMGHAFSCALRFMEMN